MANRTDLVNFLRQELEWTKIDSETAVDTVLEGIVSLTKDEGKLQMIGFGNFEVKERAARKGRNPQDGSEIQIEAKNAVGFKPGKYFKESVL